jgi:hypothetical protein
MRAGKSPRSLWAHRRTHRRGIMESGEAGFAADHAASLNQFARIPKLHSELIRLCHFSGLSDILRKPHRQTP